MNEVFLEGVIVSVDKPKAADKNNHLVYQLRMTHRNRHGQLKQELFTVNAWNRLADWAENNIGPGIPVFVKGYLTQRSHGGEVATQVTASRFVIMPTISRAEEALSILSNG